MTYQPYRIFATDDPKMIGFKQVVGVSLQFDRLGIQQFSKFVSEYARDFDELERLSHAHFRDSLYWDYWQKQMETKSRDVLLLPLPSVAAGGMSA